MASAIILAGGASRRLSGRFKAVLELCGRPMLSYVLEAVSGLAEETIVVVSTEEQAEILSGLELPAEPRVVVDEEAGPKCPLLGLTTGLRAARADVALVLACDMPLVSRAVLSFLLEVLSYMNAVVPRWPNGFIEPLQAVYRTGKAARASLELLRSGGPYDMRSFLAKLGRVRYVSTKVIEQLDPGLTTFLNVNTPADLRKAETILRARRACGR